MMGDIYKVHAFMQPLVCKHTGIVTLDFPLVCSLTFSHPRELVKKILLLLEFHDSVAIVHDQTLLLNVL